MRIAPIDIAHKTFGRKMMGLDGDEVIEFLRDVADQMEEVIRERNSLKEAVREKDLAIMEYRERDQTLKSTIETATKMSEGIRQEAEREARLVMQDAQQKAELIVADARDSLKRIYQEISELKRSRMQFDASLRSLLHAHLAMLDQSHSMVPDPMMTVGRASAANAAAASQNSTNTQTPAPSPMAAAYAAAQQSARTQAAVQAPVSKTAHQGSLAQHDSATNSVANSAVNPYASANQQQAGGYSMSVPPVPIAPSAGPRAGHSVTPAQTQASNSQSATAGHSSIPRMPRPTQTLPK